MVNRELSPGHHGKQKERAKSLATCCINHCLWQLIMHPGSAQSSKPRQKPLQGQQREEGKTEKLWPFSARYRPDLNLQPCAGAGLFCIGLVSHQQSTSLLLNLHSQSYALKKVNKIRVANYYILALKEVGTVFFNHSIRNIIFYSSISLCCHVSLL